MALPLIAAGIAARAAAKKLASRAAGGITGAGAKQVNSMYRNTVASRAQKKDYKEKVTIPSKRIVKAAKKELKIENKALKAANKPRGLKYSKKGKTVKSKNIKLDREISESNAYMAAVKQYQSKTGRTNDVIYGTDNVLKYTPPARPNRVRGGSMKSKLNFPKGMK